MRRSWLLLSMAIGCATPRRAPAPPSAASSKPAEAPPSTRAAAVAEVAALVEARRLGAEAESVGPPAVPVISTQAEALAFLNGPVKDWIPKKRLAVEAAVRAYAASLPHLNAAELAVAALEVGDLWTSFVSTFVDLSLAAVPPPIKADQELLRAYRAAILEAPRSQLEHARAAYQLCLAKAGPAASSTAERCRRQLSKLELLAPVEQTSASAGRELPKPKPHVRLPKRAWLPSSQPAPCVFAGTLRLGRASLWSSPGVATSIRPEALELSKLELPTRRSEPFRLTTSWPVRASVYLDAAWLPLTTRRRVVLVADHVWLRSGTAVAAAAPLRAKALVYKEAPGATPDPAQQVACSELGLAGDVEPPQSPAKDPRYFVGDVRLYASPAGKELGRFSLKAPERFGVRGERGDWLHVVSDASDAGELPYDFDAWTDSRPTSEPSQGMIGLLDESAAPSHVVTRELELFTSPARSSKLGVLVTGVEVLVGETRDGFVNVDVPGLPRFGSDWGFWIEQGDFQVALRKL
jgi:hypothetical protein